MVRGSWWVCEKEMIIVPTAIPLTNSYAPPKCQFGHHLLREAFPPGRIGCSPLSIFTVPLVQGFFTYRAGAERWAYLSWLNFELPQGTDPVPLFLAFLALGTGLKPSRAQPNVPATPSWACRADYRKPAS